MYAKILLCFDGSREGWLALHEGARLAQTTGARVVGPIGRFVRRIPLRWNNVGTAKFLLFLGSVCKLLILLYRAVLRLVRLSFQLLRDSAVPRWFQVEEAVCPVFYPSVWRPGCHLWCARKSVCVQNARWPRRHGKSVLRQRMWCRSALPG